MIWGPVGGPVGQIESETEPSSRSVHSKTRGRDGWRDGGREGGREGEGMEEEKRVSRVPIMPFLQNQSILSSHLVLAGEHVGESSRFSGV